MQDIGAFGRIWKSARKKKKNREQVETETELRAKVKIQEYVSVSALRSPKEEEQGSQDVRLQAKRQAKRVPRRRPVMWWLEAILCCKAVQRGTGQIPLGCQPRLCEQPNAGHPKATDNVTTTEELGTKRENDAEGGFCSFENVRTSSMFLWGLHRLVGFEAAETRTKVAKDGCNTVAEDAGRMLRKPC